MCKTSSKVQRIKQHVVAYYPIYALSILFIFLNILNFFNSGLYWDDWWLVSLSPDDLVEMYRQIGMPLYSFMHGWLLKTPSYIWVYRGLFIILNYISTISIYAIFRDVIFKDRYLATVAAAFFIVLPLNFPKIIIICFPYAVCTAFFYSAFYLAISFKKSLPLRLLSLVLFFFSFITGSLFCLYSLFVGFLYYHVGLFRVRSVVDFCKVIIKHLDYLLVPVGFLLFKFYILPQPSGEYINYNKIQHFSTDLFLHVPIALYVILKKVFSLQQLLAASIIATLISFFLYRKIKWADPKMNLGLFVRLFIFSVASLFLIIFPYLLVGRSHWQFGLSWRGRDELLIPFGLSVFIIFVPLTAVSFKLLRRYTFVKILFLFTIPLILALSFSYSTLKTQVQFLRDMIKQDALLSFYEDEKEMWTNHTFHFIDECPSLNIFEREFGNSELHGMAQSIFKTQDRYFNLTADITGVCPDHLKIGTICKFWRREFIQKRIVISMKDEPLKSVKVLELMLLKIVDSSLYKMELRKYFAINLLPPISRL